jgi:dTDP-glucose 4,6-dehydratase
MRVLVTGGAGFIGSNFIRYLIDNRPDWNIVNFDKLTYAGNLANLADIADHDNYSFVKGDISILDDVRAVFKNGFDYIVNFAAETHVDRSLYEPGLFLKTNALGTQILLDFARERKVRKFIHISTDEVYGSIEPGKQADETFDLAPNSPYAASKASADLICHSYYKSFDLPVIITRSCNNYGPFQYPEKVIPFFITRALNNDNLPLYGDGSNMRDWLYVDDNCEAILTILERGKPGEIYNISGDSQLANLELTRKILRILGKPDELIKFVDDRPGHDFRYALDSSKIKKELGWSPSTKFDEGIQKTIAWYRENQTWRESIKSGEYLKFYQLHYRNRQ